MENQQQNQEFTPNAKLPANVRSSSRNDMPIDNTKKLSMQEQYSQAIENLVKNQAKNSESYYDDLIEHRPNPAPYATQIEVDLNDHGTTFDGHN